MSKYLFCMDIRVCIFTNKIISIYVHSLFLTLFISVAWKSVSITLVMFRWSLLTLCLLPLTLCGPNDSLDQLVAALTNVRWEDQVLLLLLLMMIMMRIMTRCWGPPSLPTRGRCPPGCPGLWSATRAASSGRLTTPPASSSTG